MQMWMLKLGSIVEKFEAYPEFIWISKGDNEGAVCYTKCKQFNPKTYMPTIIVQGMYHQLQKPQTLKP